MPAETPPPPLCSIAAGPITCGRPLPVLGNKATMQQASEHQLWQSRALLAGGWCAPVSSSRLGRATDPQGGPQLRCQLTHSWMQAHHMLHMRQAPACLDEQATMQHASEHQLWQSRALLARRRVMLASRWHILANIKRPQAGAPGCHASWLPGAAQEQAPLTQSGGPCSAHGPLELLTGTSPGAQGLCLQAGAVATDVPMSVTTRPACKQSP
jgi:hypothetical protein